MTPPTTHVGKYRVIKRLGKGGMGIVYKALSPEIDKVVALKLLAPSEALSITMEQKDLENIFFSEAKTLARLDHANIVSIWDFDRDEKNRPFFIMDYHCNNLGEMIGEQFRVERPSRPIGPEKVIHYGLQILDALQYLHYHGIVHRDIKPHNLLVTDQDTVKICDFGMALVDNISFSGPANMQIGSPCYTPPEQRKTPHEVDGRADCYSAAVLLYRMLTGSLPGMQSFPLSLVNPAYDSGWDDFFRISLSWDPAARFQEAVNMRAALATLPVPTRNRAARQYVPKKSRPGIRLRATPDNQCGARARTRFELTELLRPRRYIDNCFTIDEATVTDQRTGLVWQRSGSPYPLPWQQAHHYLEELNRDGFGNIRTWRLPTLNELLSLLDKKNNRPSATLFAVDKKWFWSSDHHGTHERWYVNLDMGFTAPQDMYCRNHIRAVADHRDGVV